MNAVWFCPLCYKEGSDARRRLCPDDGTPVRPISERGAQWIGRTLAGKYKVLRFVGRGGMADVFEVERLPDGKHLALKILNSENLGNERLSERFRREAVLISLIAHPNVVNLLDFGTLEDHTNYMVMELLSGRSLKDALAAGPIPPVDACRIVLQVCEGMAAAHERGVIHRDLKPDNIFLQDMGPGNDPVVKILDLGLGKLSTRPNKRLTNAGALLGTPEYMSPEQCNGEEAGIPSDIYALGVMLYEMFMGFLPFVADSFLMTMSAHVAELPIWHRKIAIERDLPWDAEVTVLRALSKSPSERQESMLEFQRDVSSILSRLRHGGRYSLPEANHVSSKPAASAAAGTKVRVTPASAPSPTAFSGSSIKRVTLSEAKGDNRETAVIAEGIYWVGRRRDTEVESNAYLRVCHGSGRPLSILFDPGAPADFGTVAAKVSHVLGGLENLGYVFLSGPDLEVAGSVGEIVRVQPNVFIICSEDTRRIVRRLGVDLKRFLSVESLPGGCMSSPTGHCIQFIPAPFCRFRGATMAFDQQEAVLFSGDLFSGIGGPLLPNAGWRESLSELHSLYMPSKTAVENVLRAIEHLEPFPAFIAPRYGAVIPGNLIRDAVECLSNIPLGPELYQNEDLVSFLVHP